MAARRKAELYLEINNTREFETALNRNKDVLICAELYCEFAGPCTALDRLFTTMKLDWSNGEMVLLKVLVDEIEVLERFRDQCEPLYLFILNKRVTAMFRGVDSIELGKIGRQEIDHFSKRKLGMESSRPTYALNEQTPQEKVWRKSLALEMEQEQAVIAERRAKRQAERKRHRAELMAPHLGILNFVLYWPHARHAHIELYERWDLNNIIMVGREEVCLSEDRARDVLYAGDVDLNPAALHALLAAPALAICFRSLETDRDFVTVTRKILYEDLPELDENKPAGEQKRKTAFDTYKTYSKTREEILRLRAKEKMRKKEELAYNRARRLSEMQRMARQQKEDAIQAKRHEKEELKLQLLKHGKLDELEQLKKEPDYEGNSFVIPEALPDVEEESAEEDEDAEEYFPPPGLLIPAFYAPPNDVAKANGLAILFPKLVNEYVTPTAEFLPPHVLVLLHVAQRYKALQVLAKFKNYIIHMGFFKMASLEDAQHLCYTVKEFDALQLSPQQLAEVKLAFMVSTSSELALLQLTDCLPLHVSRDSETGQDECALLFHVRAIKTFLSYQHRDCINTVWGSAVFALQQSPGSNSQNKIPIELDGEGNLYL